MTPTIGKPIMGGCRHGSEWLHCDECKRLGAMGTYEANGQVFHELKIRPTYYRAMLDGEKTFEIRKNDRGFRAGDVLVLKEWNGERFTKAPALVKRVSYLTDFEQAPGVVVMGLKPARFLVKRGQR